MKALLKDRNKRKKVKKKESYTFDNFVVGKSNAIAYTLCLDVAKRKSEYNPIYIYGKKGLGKTHLLKSIFEYYTKKHKSQKALYITCKEFVDNYVESIMKHNEKKVIDKFKRLNLLLVDETEYLIDKFQSQEELFRIFNLLYESNTQILFSSSLPIKKLNKFDERLKNRFEWGAICEILPPDYNTRFEILKLKLKEKRAKYPIDDMVLRYIAKRISSDIRRLEGCLNNFILHTKLKKYPITFKEAKRLIKNHV